MAIEIHIAAEGNTVRVTPSGELVVAPLNYDETSFNELAVAATGYNFYEPLPGKQFVITAVLMRADKNVSNVTDATVVIYEANSTDSITIDKTLIQFAVVRDDIITSTPLRILVAGGTFINGKTSDASIHMTITGYYIDKLG